MSIRARRTPQQTTAPIEARGSLQTIPEGSVPDWIMWMPGGVHHIEATRRGKPVSLRVRVDRRTAAVAQQALGNALTAGRQRPFFDFNHKGEAASAWPQEFAWRETPEPGVYARVEWSGPGREAIAGRAYRAFSPTFLVNAEDPAEVIGAPLNMGGLVNDPAFVQIAPHFASRPQNHTTMTPEQRLIAAQSALLSLIAERDAIAASDTAARATKEAAITAKRTEITALEAEVEASSSDTEPTIRVVDGSAAIRDKEAKITQLQADLTKAQGEIAAQRRRDADAAVQAAVASGVIPAQDTARQDSWRKRIEADPTLADELRAMGNRGAATGAIDGQRITGQPNRGQATVIKEDTRRVVAAYKAAIADPIEAARIYADDIRPRLNAKDGGVITAANSLGGVVGNLVVQRSLDLLKTEFPLLSRVSTDFSGENAGYGQTVKTRILTPPAATDYNTSTGYATSDATTTDVDVVINAHKAVQVSFNANELAGTRRMLFDEQREGMHFSLGEAMVAALYALITSGNFSNATTKAEASFDRKTVASMARALNTRKVPKAGRTLLLNPAYFEALTSDNAIIALAAQQDRQYLTEYRVPPIAGFQPFEAIDLPTTGNLTGFGLAPSALAIATRVPNDYSAAFPGVDGGGAVSTVTNPDTGVTVMVVQHVNHTLGAATMRLALMYGVAVGNALCGQRLIGA